jgi:hypothetical protein
VRASPYTTPDLDVDLFDGDPDQVADALDAVVRTADVYPMCTDTVADPPATA